MSPYEHLEQVVTQLRAEHPSVAITVPSSEDPASNRRSLVVRRDLPTGYRMVRRVAHADPVVSFYWAYLPDAHAGSHYVHPYGEGNVYGDVDYFRYFIKRFIFELVDREQISRSNLDGTPPDVP